MSKLSPSFLARAFLSHKHADREGNVGDRAKKDDGNGKGNGAGGPRGALASRDAMRRVSYEEIGVVDPLVLPPSAVRRAGTPRAEAAGQRGAPQRGDDHDDDGNYGDDDGGGDDGPDGPEISSSSPSDRSQGDAMDTAGGDARDGDDDNGDTFPSRAASGGNELGEDESEAWLVPGGGHKRKGKGGQKGSRRGKGKGKGKGKERGKRGPATSEGYSPLPMRQGLLQEHGPGRSDDPDLAPQAGRQNKGKEGWKGAGRGAAFKVGDGVGAMSDEGRANAGSSGVIGSGAEGSSEKKEEAAGPSGQVLEMGVMSSSWERLWGGQGGLMGSIRGIGRAHAAEEESSRDPPLSVALKPHVPPSLALLQMRPTVGDVASQRAELAVNMRRFLDHVLCSLDVVNSKSMLKFLEVSVHSFKEGSGPKCKEGKLFVRASAFPSLRPKVGFMGRIFPKWWKTQWVPVWAVIQTSAFALYRSQFVEGAPLDVIQFDVTLHDLTRINRPRYGDASHGPRRLCGCLPGVQLTLDSVLHLGEDRTEDAGGHHGAYQALAEGHSPTSRATRPYAKVARLHWQRPFHMGFSLCCSGRQLDAHCGRWVFRSRDWVEAINREVAMSDSWQPNDYGSFAPRRDGDGCKARCLVDGEEMFAAVASAMLAATKEIYILGWWISPELYLRRPFSAHEWSRLDRLLLRKASEGVQIYIVMYKEVRLAMGLNSESSKRKLTSLHPNIRVIRHPDYLATGVLLWSHHEKLVVVDRAHAFVGGMDLCFGRWDASNHRLFDDPPTTWQGKDYYNPRVLEPGDWEDPAVDVLDRARVPRMPWHDVGCEIVGDAATDLVRHFVQRWNHAKRMKSPASVGHMPYLMPPGSVRARQLSAMAAAQRQAALAQAQAALARAATPEAADLGAMTPATGTMMLPPGGRLWSWRSRQGAMRVPTATPDTAGPPPGASLAVATHADARGMDALVQPPDVATKGLARQLFPPLDARQGHVTPGGHDLSASLASTEMVPMSHAMGPMANLGPVSLVSASKGVAGPGRVPNGGILQGSSASAAAGHHEGHAWSTHAPLSSAHTKASASHIGGSPFAKSGSVQRGISVLAGDLAVEAGVSIRRLSRGPSSPSPSQPGHRRSSSLPGLATSADDVLAVPSQASRGMVASRSEARLGAWEMASAPAGPGEPSIQGRQQRCSVQVLRSIGQWSAGGSHAEEASVLTAYCSLIACARHFVYIENQFFVSGMAGDEQVRNRVAQALLGRIQEAASKGETFRVIIVLPLMPGLQGGVNDAGGAAALRAVMHFQYRSLCRGGDSLLESVARVVGPERVFDYITVYGLRVQMMAPLRGGHIGAVTSQVYVHSKLLIVDDFSAIIGSANLNDRSLLGARDSEIAVLLQGGDPIELRFGGKPAVASRLVHELRMALLREHMDLTPEEEMRMVDIVDPKAYVDLMIGRAAMNTASFWGTYGCVPSDSIRSAAAFRAHLRKNGDHNSGDGRFADVEAMAAASTARPPPPLTLVPVADGLLRPTGRGSVAMIDGQVDECGLDLGHGSVSTGASTGRGVAGSATHAPSASQDYQVPDKASPLLGGKDATAGDNSTLIAPSLPPGPGRRPTEPVLVADRKGGSSGTSQGAPPPSAPQPIVNVLPRAVADVAPGAGGIVAKQAPVTPKDSTGTWKDAFSARGLGLGFLHLSRNRGVSPAAGPGAEREDASGATTPLSARTVASDKAVTPPRQSTAAGGSSRRGEVALPPRVRAPAALAPDIRGNLVMFPLRYMEDEDLRPSVLKSEYYVFTAFQ
eukprot:jgi/Mesvir1/7101/Mv09207-RA.1